LSCRPDSVTEIFVRVNSLGAKLRSSDLALAQITAKWRNSLKIFEAFQHQCGKTGFDLDLGLYLKNLVVFTTGQSRFLTVGTSRTLSVPSSTNEIAPTWMPIILEETALCPEVGMAKAAPAPAVIFRKSRRFTSRLKGLLLYQRLVGLVIVAQR
jgi:hypothetical protein